MISGADSDGSPVRRARDRQAMRDLDHGSRRTRGADGHAGELPAAMCQRHPCAIGLLLEIHRNDLASVLRPTGMSGPPGTFVGRTAILAEKVWLLARDAKEKCPD